MIDAYVQDLLGVIAASPFVSTSDVTFDKRSLSVAFVRGAVYFADESVLHFRELVDLRGADARSMYAYHYQRGDGSLVFRYDNSGHFPRMASYPHHKHAGEQASVVST